MSTQNSCEYSDSRGGAHHVRYVQELSRDRQQRSAADRGDTQNLYLPLTVMQVQLETDHNYPRDVDSTPIVDAIPSPIRDLKQIRPITRLVRYVVAIEKEFNATHDPC